MDRWIDSISSGPSTVSTLSCVELSGDVNITVKWTLSNESADFYLISFMTNAPQTPYDGLLNITASVTQHELTGFMADYEYNITVHGVNCGSQEGNESEPLTIRPQGITSNCSFNCSSSYMHVCNEIIYYNDIIFVEISACSVINFI